MYMIAACVAVLAIAPVATSAQAGPTGLLVVAHGGTAEWNGQVRETVAQVRWNHGPVATAFLMGPEADSSGWNAAVARMVATGTRSVIVVPLMVSSYGSHYRQVRFYGGQRDQLPPELAAHDHGPTGPPPLPMRVTSALDAAPELLDAVAQRWRELDPRLTAAPLVLLGHGPNTGEDAARWTAAFEAALEQVGSSGHRQERRSALLRDDAPAPVRAQAVRELRDTVTALATRAGDSVTVMTVLIAQGSMTSERIPRDLEGLPARYAPVGLTPLPVIARWIERMAEAARQSP